MLAAAPFSSKNMICVNTVLVLGAGASVHCGYPLVTQLVINVLSNLRSGSVLIETLAHSGFDGQADTKLRESLGHSGAFTFNYDRSLKEISIWGLGEQIRRS
jgi:hypothetical protein